MCVGGGGGGGGGVLSSLLSCSCPIHHDVGLITEEGAC